MRASRVTGNRTNTGTVLSPCRGRPCVVAIPTSRAYVVLSLPYLTPIDSLSPLYAYLYARTNAEHMRYAAERAQTRLDLVRFVV
jgi:hypothetical protein